MTETDPDSTDLHCREIDRAVSAHERSKKQKREILVSRRDTHKKFLDEAQKNLDEFDKSFASTD